MDARQARILELTEPLAEIAAANAGRHDREGTFPHDTVNALVAAGFHTLTLPEELGGMGATPLETMIALERLARGDGSVALAMCMHLSAIHSLATSDAWRGPARDRMVAEVVGDGGLYNTADSEAGLGSPSRGGAFATTAAPTGDGGWRIAGRKSWTTLSPALRWAGVSATVLDDAGEPSGRARFLVPMDAPGVAIDETWDNMSMGATGSHDLVLDDVVVPDDHWLPAPGKPSSSPWSILTSAVYLGVGVAARDFTIAFAKTRTPAAMGGKAIATLPNVQHRVAEIEVRLLAARETLYGVVQQWQACPELRETLGWQMAGAKVLVTNNAIDITDQALRVVGSVGLQRRHPLERYFRDVRAGLGNPPLDDVAMGIIGRAALGE
jgi:alkylation response protein AidB-like acyl-CoA dehydrogenase